MTRALPDDHVHCLTHVNVVLVEYCFVVVQETSRSIEKNATPSSDRHEWCRQLKLERNWEEVWEGVPQSLDFHGAQAEKLCVYGNSKGSRAYPALDMVDHRGNVVSRLEAKVAQMVRGRRSGYGRIVGHLDIAERTSS